MCQRENEDSLWRGWEEEKKKEQNDKGTNDKPVRTTEREKKTLREMHGCDSSSQIKDAPGLYGFLHNVHSDSLSMFVFQLVHKEEKKKHIWNGTWATFILLVSSGGESKFALWEQQHLLNGK